MAMDRRIALVGVYRSGKTTFLTSLINHLNAHDLKYRYHCAIGQGHDKILAFRELPCTAGTAGPGPFNYQKHRQRMVEEGVWPGKTKVVSEYRCRFKWKKSEKRKPTHVRLSFLDVPGERMADVLMKGKDYDKWADQILKFLDLRPEYRAVAQEYLSLIQSSDAVAEDEILQTYRRTLAGLILECKPIVTPSTFLVDVKGKLPPRSDRTVDLLAETRFSGLAADSQFAPLPKRVRDEKPEMADIFRKRYAEYTKTIVRPIVRWIRKADILLAFVDVTMLLAGGLGMYEGHKELFTHLVDRCNPGRTRLGAVGDWLVRTVTFGQIRFPAVRKLGFVATKDDLVLHADRQRMTGLVDAMTRKLVDGIDGLEIECFDCAAVDSTEQLLDGRLEGRLMENQRRREQLPEAFRPSGVPDTWPEDWSDRDYSFPRVFPDWPPRRDMPPKQIGLHRILNFILE